MGDGLTLEQMEEETRAVRALAEGLAFKEGVRTEPRVGHFERASQTIARMRRLDPKSALLYIRIASEAGLLRQAIGSGAMSLFFEVEVERLTALEEQYSPRDLRSCGRDYLWLVTRAIEGVRFDPRVQDRFRGRQEILESWVAFSKRRIIPYYRALSARRFSRRFWREWTEPIHWLW